MYSCFLQAAFNLTHSFHPFYEPLQLYEFGNCEGGQATIPRPTSLVDFQKQRCSLPMFPWCDLIDQYWSLWQLQLLLAVADFRQ